MVEQTSGHGGPKREAAITFARARKVPQDARLVMTWRNDPYTLEMSYHQEPKQWESFWKEYCVTYFQFPDLSPLFALLDGERIGFLRFSPYSYDLLSGRVVDISINIAPAWRNQGLGTRVLKAVTREIFKRGVEVIVAEIKQKNSASIRAFEKAGYRFWDRQEKRVPDTGTVVPIFRYVAMNHDWAKMGPRRAKGLQFKTGEPD